MTYTAAQIAELVAEGRSVPGYENRMTLYWRLADALEQCANRIAAVEKLCDTYEDIWAEAGIGDSGGIEIRVVRAALRGEQP